MSELENLYSNFVLRDILSFIIPGAIVSLALILPERIRFFIYFSHFWTNILSFIIILGLFYIIGFSIQIFREILTQFFSNNFKKLSQKLINWINKRLNSKSQTYDKYVDLRDIYRTTNQVQEKFNQILERFTVFFQLCGNSCLAFFIVFVIFLLKNSFEISLISLISLSFCILMYIGYVIHKRRYDIWISVILNREFIEPTEELTSRSRQRETINDGRLYAIIGSVFLVVAIVGLIVFDANSFFSDNILIVVQSGSIVYLALLSVALFYVNNKIEMAELTHRPWIANFGLVLLVLFVLGLLGIEIISELGGIGIYKPPLFMGSLAIGLFYANKSIRYFCRPSNSSETELMKESEVEMK